MKILDKIPNFADHTNGRAYTVLRRVGRGSIFLTLVPAAVFWRRLIAGSWGGGVFYPQAYLEF